MLSNKTLIITGIMLGLMLVGAALGIYSSRYYPRSPSAEAIPGLLWPNPKQLVEFNTTDHRSSSFGLSNLKGEWSLLFFGYTYCPDVCPVTLTVLAQIQESLQKSITPAIRTVFVTVDPERDTSARLAEYIDYFHKDFIALGGTRAQINSLTSQIGIAWSHAPAVADGSYLVNHSSAVFLLDPNARLVGIFSAPHDPDTLMAGIVRITDYINSQN